MADADRVTVLHVDDDPDFAELAATFLERTDVRLEVLTETSPEAGLELLGAREVDCVVSDYDMPGTDGLAFLEAVRAEHPGLPFVLFTGKGSEEIASEAITRGVTDYLQKGAGTGQYRILANRIENAVGKARAERQVERTRAWYSALLASIPDYVFVVDGAGEISYCSPSVERVMGYDPDALVGESAFAFTHPDDVDEALASFEAVIESPGRDVTVTFRARDADGDWRELEVRGRNLLEDDTIGGVVVNARVLAG